MSLEALPHGTKLQNGAFVVGRVAGQGGFGITYHGADTRLQRHVAVKEFFPFGCVRQGCTIRLSNSVSPPDYESGKQKFLQEARTLASFRHAGIVQILTVFEENETAYMVMEFLRGQTLQQIVQGRGALPEDQVLGYARQMSEALETVHRSNLIHRDIKPENVITCDDGRVVLIDFGLNKKIEESGALGTRRLSSTAAFGTSGYAPPEQYGKQVPVGTFTDVYALGATLYFLLTGKVPLEALDRLQGVALPSPCEVRSGISRHFSNAVMEAMALKGSDRPQTPRALLNRLSNPPFQPAPIAVAPAMALQPSQSAKSVLLHDWRSHRNSVQAVEFSPDGKLLASAGADTQLIVREVETGRIIQGASHRKQLTSLAYSPDGMLLAVGAGDASVLLWDVRAAEWRPPLRSHSSRINAVAFSFDGKTVASVSKDGTLFLWDAVTGTVAQRLEARGQEMSSVDFSPDGVLVATAIYDQVLLWNLRSGTVFQIAHTNFQRINCAQFSPDGTLLATGDDKAIKLWEVATGALKQTFSKHRYEVSSLCFSLDGTQLLSGSVSGVANGIIKLWDVSSGNVVQNLSQDATVNDVAFSPDGTLLATAGGSQGRGCAVKVWRISKVAAPLVSPTPALPAASPLAANALLSARKRGRRIGNIDDFIELWPHVLVRFKKKIGVTAVAYLQDARPVRLDGHYAVLEFQNEFHYTQACQAKARLPFEQVLNEVLATPHVLIFKLAPPA